MNEFKTALKEYQELQYIAKNHVDEMIFLLDKVNSFKSGISSIEESIQMSLENPSEEYDFISPIFNNYMQGIHKTLLLYNEQVTVPLKKNIEYFNTEVNSNINSFNQIKTNLIESKQKVIKTKDDYYKFIESNKNIKKEKDDQKELFKAKKDNFAQLYKYEVNKMNETITKHNIKYNEILKNLDEINTCSNSIVKKILTKFSKNIENIGKIFIKLSDDINESINTNNEKLENKRFISQIDDITKKRFNFETFEEYGEKKEEKINIEKLGQNKPQEDEKESNKNKNEKVDKSLYFKRLMSLPRKGFDDFEVIDSPIEIMDLEKMNKHINELTNIIKKLASEEELTPTEITQLINILKEDPPENKQTFSFIFLTKIKKFHNNRVINFKNRQNFIHLANIMNNICIKEDNFKTFNAIIEVSKMIKYENLFMFCMIQKKNQFFSTKTFWLKVIQDNLIDNLNIHVNKLLTNKVKINNNKINNNNNKNIKKNLLLSIGLDKEILNYDKLNDQQKNYLDIFAYEMISKILSKRIPAMCSFLVPEFTSIEIITHYYKLFNFDKATIYYFQNLLGAKNIKNTSSLKKNTDAAKKKKTMFNNIFIISCTLKFLPKTEIINLFHLNKVYKPQLDKKIFKFLLSNENLSIEKRLELWGIILKVKDTMNLITYQEVKQTMKERIDEHLIVPKCQEDRNIETIRVDLIRTQFINKSQEHIEKVGWVLKCLNFIKPDVGYCQGMNILALFFYQLLDYDEEKTFYYMFAFERESKYEEIFKDDLYMLKLFFIVLDKIINLYKPEIYYKFLDTYLSTNIYSTPWFVTLFTNINSVFEKKNAPKYVIMVFESFIVDGWSAIFNSGFTLCKYYFDKIMKIEGDLLINFMIKDLIDQDIVNNENFQLIKEIYNKNSEQINELLISKLVKITKYENAHSYLTKKDS